MPEKKDLKDKLTPEQYRVCILQGTESPFTGEHLNNKASGVYCCVCCSKELFSSQDKFDSGSGWPSYLRPIANAVKEKPDTTHGFNRVEVRCNHCDAHLGHVFPDGPPPTHLRYCINSVALLFKKAD